MCNLNSVDYCLDSGVHFKQSYADAIKWYQDAASRGHYGAKLGLIWIYSTAKDSKFQNGELAVHTALRYISEDSSPWNLEILAAAYARNGQYSDAIRLQRKAISQLPTNDKSINYFNNRLSLYMKGQPFTE